jgi:hypothetical protein
MNPTDKHLPELPDSGDGTGDFPVVKPGSASRVGRNTLEDRAELAVRPAQANRSAARSTHRDLHTV